VTDVYPPPELDSAAKGHGAGRCPDPAICPVVTAQVIVSEVAVCSPYLGTSIWSRGSALSLTTRARGPQNFPDTPQNFPDPRNIFPVKLSRKFFEKCLQRSGL